MRLLAENLVVSIEIQRRTERKREKKKSMGQIISFQQQFLFVSINYKPKIYNLN